MEIHKKAMYREIVSKHEIDFVSIAAWADINIVEMQKIIRVVPSNASSNEWGKFSPSVLEMQCIQGWNNYFTSEKIEDQKFLTPMKTV